MEERLIDLETRFAFQEDALQAINITVNRQQRSIEELMIEIKTLKTQIRQMAASPLADRSDELPPPHY